MRFIVWGGVVLIPSLPLVLLLLSPDYKKILSNCGGEAECLGQFVLAINPLFDFLFISAALLWPLAIYYCKKLLEQQGICSNFKSYIFSTTWVVLFIILQCMFFFLIEGTV